MLAQTQIRFWWPVMMLIPDSILRPVNDVLNKKFLRRSKKRAIDSDETGNFIYFWKILVLRKERKDWIKKKKEKMRYIIYVRMYVCMHVCMLCMYIMYVCICPNLADQSDNLWKRRKKIKKGRERENEKRSLNWKDLKIFFVIFESIFKRYSRTILHIFELIHQSTGHIFERWCIAMIK